jgi:hypothetical protein
LVPYSFFHARGTDWRHVDLVGDQQIRLVKVGKHGNDRILAYIRLLSGEKKQPEKYGVFRCCNRRKDNCLLVHLESGQPKQYLFQTKKKAQ